MGLCLGPVPKRYRCYRSGETHARSGLHYRAVAAQQVRNNKLAESSSLVLALFLPYILQVFILCSSPTNYDDVCFRYLTYCLDSEKIRRMYATSVIVSIASNSIGQSLAWDFIQANWGSLYNE